MSAIDDEEVGTPHRLVPALTLLILAVSLVTIYQGWHDQAFYDLMRRNPDRLHQGEWWRIASPLLVDRDKILLQVPNFLGILIFGTAIERSAGRLWMLTAFLAGGIAGQLAAYAWAPPGAGNSVAMLGLAGCALIAFTRPARAILATAAILTAIYFTYHQDMHGPAALAGIAVGLLIMLRDSTSR